MKTKLGRTLLCLLGAALISAFTGKAQSTVTQIAAGGGQDIYGNVLGGHSLFIKSDGSLWAMGNNQYGQLGDGSTADSHVPEVIASGVTAISAGYGHSLYIKKRQAGTITELWGMGYNNDGELGDGTAVNRAVPVKIKSYSSIIGGFLVTAIAAGGYHSLLIKGDGTLWAMGLNYYGELGDKSINNSYAPEQVYTNVPVTAIAAGGYHSMFIDSTSNLWTMGANSYGQLGLENTNDTLTPMNVKGLPPVGAIAAGAYHSLLLGAGPGSGQVYVMGEDEDGQLGLGFSSDSPFNILIAYLEGPEVAIAEGSAHSHVR
jgi:alpha-tubulin suppressor-like RCC1 family protein